MHAYIIIGKGNSVEAEIEKIVRKIKAKRLNFSLNKIDEVRTLSNFTKLKINEPTAIVVKEIENSSLDALNAFLKNLEEPQVNLFYVLSANSLYNVIPTILSRCQIIKLKVNPILDNDTENEIEAFINSDLSYKLTLISKMRDRKASIAFIENLIVYIHKLFVTSTKKQNYANILSSANNALHALHANGNINLHMSLFATKI